MASAGPGPSGKRAMDAEVNLVPFIDLLSCCICFLLISAVWTQVAKIDVKPAPNMPASEEPPPENKVALKVHVRDAGYFLSDGASTLELPKAGVDYPSKDLEAKLKLMRDAYPDNAAITVMSDDVVPYKELIKVMDLCLQMNLDDITVSGT